MKKNSFLAQFICFFLILLSCLLIGFGSWLETNDLFYLSNPITSQRYSLFKVIMTTDTKTRILSIGLWRYCISDTDISECSPIKMNFNLDAFTLMDNILYNNISQLPTLASNSYIRLIPLLIASFIGVISVCISIYLLPGNQKKSVQRKALLWLTSILCFLSGCLISITFGLTYYQYTKNIKSACSYVLSKHDINNTFICQSYTLSVEIILLALAIGVFIISSIYCMLISSHNQLADSCKTQCTNNSNFSFYVSEEEYRQPTLNIEEKQLPDETIYNKERMSLRPPPSFAHNIERNGGCRSITDHSPLKHDNKPDSITDVLQQTATDIKFTSSTEDILLPPTLPFANNRRSTYNHNNSRPLSHGSANTFGAVSINDLNHTPSSSADDDSQSSCYHQRNDSGTSTYNPLIYSGTQSNHTLGTFHHTTKPSSSAYLYYNSSFEDEDGRSFNNSSGTTNKSSSIISRSSNIPEQASNDLSKRIHDYLQTK